MGPGYGLVLSKPLFMWKSNKYCYYSWVIINTLFHYIYIYIYTPHLTEGNTQISLFHFYPLNKIPLSTMFQPPLPSSPPPPKSPPSKSIKPNSTTVISTVTITISTTSFCSLFFPQWDSRERFEYFKWFEWNHRLLFRCILKSPNKASEFDKQGSDLKRWTIFRNLWFVIYSYLHLGIGIKSQGNHMSFSLTMGMMRYMISKCKELVVIVMSLCSILINSFGFDIKKKLTNQ